MTVLDFLVLLVVSVSVVSGATKGIIRVIVSVAFTVAGLVLAAHCYVYAADLLRIFAAGWRTEARASGLGRSYPGRRTGAGQRMADMLGHLSCADGVSGHTRGCPEGLFRPSASGGNASDRLSHFARVEGAILQGQ